MKISVVIPNYNGKELLTKNLPKVVSNSSIDEIVVVDDGSTDDSCRYIKKHFPKIKLIEKITNSGFSTTVNIGVKAARGDIVFLLNTDAVPEKECIERILPHFAQQEVFAVGCLDKSIESEGVVQRGRGVGRFIRGFLMHSRGEVNKTDTLWVSGGSGAFRKSIWEKLGGMDELYDPFYWEDIDLSYRAMKSGFRIIFEPRAQVEHRHQEGSIGHAYSKDKITQIAYRNQFIFVWKNITDLSYIVRHLLWLLYHLISAIFRGDFALGRGFFQAVTLLKEITIKRHHQSISFRKTDKQILHQFSI